MLRAFELAPSSSFAELALEGELGRGATATVHASRLDGLPIVLKVGRTRDEAAVLAHEARVLLRGGGETLAQPLAVAWMRVDCETATLAPEDPRSLPVLLMRRATGSSLRDRGHTDLDAVLSIAEDIGRALDHLHVGGIAHGDVKLDNVLADDSARATLIDLGLATEARSREVRGATPRYLARGDSDLGDARSRDLLAFGLMLAELARPELQAEPSLLGVARRTSIVEPLGEICVALLAPSPEARASARWVAERVADARGMRASTDPARAADSRTSAMQVIRNAYVRLRADVLSEPRLAGADTTEWLGGLCSWGRDLVAFERASNARAEPMTTAPLDVDAIASWIASVVGPSCLAWPLRSLASAGEVAVAAAMTRLASERPPHAWTLHEVRAAIERVVSKKDGVGDAAQVSGPNDLCAGTPIDERAAAIQLALDLAKTPASEDALRRVESDPSAPEGLVVQAARALRLRGEVGRALALARRLATSRDAAAIAASAEIHRRAGDRHLAEELATRAIDASSKRGLPDPVAIACAARLALDRGDARGAIERIGPSPGPLGFEVLALAHAQLRDVSSALRCLDEAEGSPLDAEGRARLAGARGYVLSTSDPSGAHAAFRAAVQHAASASALLEEATYATGAGASGVDEGYLQEAAEASERAARIWGHLGYAPRAARATLNAASANATAGREVEARTLALRARSLAREACDTTAAAFCACVLADLSEPRSPAGRAFSEEAVSLSGRDETETVRLYARRLRHADVDPPTLLRLDDFVIGDGGSPRCTASARADWIAARLADALATSGPRADRVDRLLASAISLADAHVPVGAKGPMLAAALECARQLGMGDASLKLAVALRESAARLLDRAGIDFVESCRRVEWVRVALVEMPEPDGVSGEQARRLEALVRSLGADTKLSELLRNVLDALVGWTGVERGLLLLPAPDGRLVPKVARNLAKRDLTGGQLDLSMSLARRALEKLEPVVAVDAAGELSDMHASVHALRLRSVLAVPLVSHGTAVGVVYLDDRSRRGAFGERELGWVRTLATLAGTMVARALTEAKLRRAATRAARHGRALEGALAEREAHIVAVESSLDTARVERPKAAAFKSIIGRSEAIERTVRVAERIAGSDVPVLVIGESGCGKELFARAIHVASRRAKTPFVSENCSAIPETLLESALFGHVRGAFTGADRNRIGLFAAADGGTLFLDEIGEMKLSLQTRLLRILEDGVVRPLGTERAQRVDVRLIAATNRDLEKMVADQTFREDLFYRLNVVALRVPPLRERREDIPFLVDHFISAYAEGRDVRITRAAMAALEAAPWPGNVRQLENEVRRALVLCDGIIDAEHLSFGGARETPTPGSDSGLDIRLRVDELEADLVRQALSKTNGNQTQAAKLLGLSRFGLQKMMKRLQIGA